MKIVDEIAMYAGPILGPDKSVSTLVREWIMFSLERWSISASISSFRPFDAMFAADRPFSEVLTDFLETIVGQEADGATFALLVRVALADSLSQILANGEGGENVGHAIENLNAAHLNEAIVEIFKTLQYFDSERAIRWASLALKNASHEKGVFAQLESPFPISIYQNLEKRTADTDARCAFFCSLYNWAERNTHRSKVFSLFPEILILRLQAVFGAKADEQQFDILSSLFNSKNILALSPVDTLDGALIQDSELYDEESIVGEYAVRLSDLTSVNVARYIRELDGAAKERWLESEVLRAAYERPLSTEPRPRTRGVLPSSVTGEGSMLELILRGATNG